MWIHRMRRNKMETYVKPEWEKMTKRELINELTELRKTHIEMGNTYKDQIEELEEVNESRAKRLAEESSRRMELIDQHIQQVGIIHAKYGNALCQSIENTNNALCRQ